MKIALLTSKENPNLAPDDALIFHYLKDQLKMDVSSVIWNQPFSINQYDLFIVRSVWDYLDGTDKFIKFLLNLEANFKAVLNPVQTILINMNKKYLFSLSQNYQVNIPQSEIIKGAEAEILLKQKELVLKPVIGAGGKNTYLGSKEELQIIYRELYLKGDHREYLVQQYIPTIIQGEISVISFGAQVSHAVIKRPKENEFRVQSDHGGTVAHFTISNELRNEVAKLLPLTEKLLYSRSDWVFFDNKFFLMELELFEPELFFRYSKDSKELFANRLKEIMKPK